MITGFLALNKEKGPSSAAVVGQVRRLLKIKKIGHSGTLDPAATGVLLLALNQATSLIQYLPTKKSYQATIRLGQTTDTLDGEGRILTTKAVPDFSRKKIEQVLNSFTGLIQQTPPMVSARHVNGKRLYQLARQGLTVNRPARAVMINKIELCGYQPPELTIQVDCSGGTYIRTLADDIGQQLGCGAYLAALARTLTGGVCLSECLTIDQLSQSVAAATWKQHVMAPIKALAHLPILLVPAQQELMLRHGQTVKLFKEAPAGEKDIMLIASQSHDLLGLGYHDMGWLKMKRVLNSNTPMEGKK